MYHYGAKPIIIIINNNGYTVERLIHGPEQGYNDIVPYDWSCALQFLGMPPAKAAKSFVRCTTREDVEALMQREDLRHPENVMIVEVMMPKLDAPWKMVKQIGGKGGLRIPEIREGGFPIRHAIVDDGEGDEKYEFVEKHKMPTL